MFKKLLATAFFIGSIFFCSPADAAITWVDNGGGATAGCNGASSCTTTSSPLAGDTLIAFSFRDGNSTGTSAPAGWTVLDNTNGSNSNGSGMFYKAAAGGAEASGTFTSATTVIIEVFRGVDTSKFNSTAGEAFCEGTGGTVSIGGTGAGCTNNFTFGDSGGTSWVFYACGHRSVDTNLEAATNTGAYTLRQNPVDGTDEAANFDTNAGVGTFAGFTKALTGTNGGWACRTQELQASAPATGRSKYTTMKAMDFYY